jgi:hypothetical protein
MRGKCRRPHNASKARLNGWCAAWCALATQIGRGSGPTLLGIAPHVHTTAYIICWLHFEGTDMAVQPIRSSWLHALTHGCGQTRERAWHAAHDNSSSSANLQCLGAVRCWPGKLPCSRATPNNCTGLYWKLRLPSAAHKLYSHTGATCNSNEAHRRTHARETQLSMVLACIVQTGRGGVLAPPIAEIRPRCVQCLCLCALLRGMRCCVQPQRALKQCMNSSQ